VDEDERAPRPVGRVAVIDVSVVICAYSTERWEALLAAVESVRRQSAEAAEIVVAVDHNEALFEAARDALPDVRVVPNRYRRGLSGTRNSGVEATHGEIVALLDDDAAAEPDWLARLTAPYSDPRVLGVGGAVEAAWLGGRPGWFPEEFDWVVGCSYRGLPAQPAPVRNFIGANMSFRREVLDVTGGFRLDMGRVGTRPLGCEETEFCIRATGRFPDGVLLYEPSARVRHAVPASRASWRYFRRRCFGEGLSKAAVSRYVGESRGLASERAYTRAILTSGLGRAVRDAAPARALAIAAGFAVTAAGYAAGRGFGETAQ
jgi:glycosyltransferase involved in cell wall biosynthesis